MKHVEELHARCFNWSLQQSSLAALSSIVERGLSAEQLARVSELLARDSIFRPVIASLIRGFREIGFLSTAAEIQAASMEDPLHENGPFAWALARGKRDLTRGAEGTESFSEAKRIAAEAEDAVEGATLLARIAWAQARADAATDALATANASQKLVLGLADERPVSDSDVRSLVEALVDVARAKARATGNKADAMPVLLQAIDLGSRSSNMNRPGFTGGCLV